jgi:hypothetical protein
MNTLGGNKFSPTIVAINPEIKVTLESLDSPTSFPPSYFIIIIFIIIDQSRNP